jgi:hypothetical protein
MSLLPLGIFSPTKVRLLVAKRFYAPPSLDPLSLIAPWVHPAHFLTKRAHVTSVGHTGDGCVTVNDDKFKTT